MSAVLTFPPVLAKSDNDEGYRPDAEDLRGLYRYRFETSLGLVMDCYLDHIAAAEATDVDPGNPEYMQLMWALVGGIDISEVIDLAPVIEKEALEEVRS